VIASRVHYEACRESGITCLPMPLRTQDFINTVSLTVENILWERKKRKTKPKERTEEEKLAKWLRDQITTDVKEVSTEEFAKLFE